MVYLYRKLIGTKSYYYLRASARKNKKVVTKDIAYLGNDLSQIREKLSLLPSKYTDEIKQTYRTINRFLEINTFLEQAKALKLKKDPFLDYTQLDEIEACKIHWNHKFLKLNAETKEEILKNFVIEFAFNTASLEGNTITLKQAQSLLVDNLTPKDKTLREIYDLQNTEKVFFKLFNSLTRNIDHDFVCDIHDSLLENIDLRNGYRTQEVRVFRQSFHSTPAPYVKTDMGILINWYKENKNQLHPFVLATIFHHKFEKIHPFMDGNGRTGRMIMNYILLKSLHPPVILRKKNRIAYLDKLHLADNSDLTKTNSKDYSEIVEFAAKELTEMYWNIFL